MKKNILNKIYKASVWCFMLIAGFLTVSCIEEGENEVEGKGSNFIRIMAETDADSEMNLGLSAFDASPGTSTLLEIRRDVVSASELAKPVTVSFEIDNTLITEYNAHVDEYNAYVIEYNKDLDEDNDGANDLKALDPKQHHIVLDPAFYSIETQTVTFAAGEFVKYIPMTLDPSTLSFTDIYSLGIRFPNDAPGYKYTSSGNNVVLHVVIKNKYHGTYSAKGYFNHPTAGSSRDIERDKELATTGPNTVETELGDLGGAGYVMELTVNPDNTVTIVGSTPSGALAVKQDYQTNTWDPATGKFDLKYSYGAPARIINEILTPK
jgi:hypothetical protein